MDRIAGTDAAVAGLFILGMMAWTVVWTPMSIKLWALMKTYYLDINKIWSVSLNGNNGLGSVKLVKPTPDGIRASKAQGGYEVPTELNFVFKDRRAGNPIAVWDEDTGMLLRPYSGEVEMGDPAVNRSAELGKAIDNMQKNGGVDWAKVAAILGVVIIVGLIILGIVMSNAA